jgi:sugar phosphate isomerase/epimerase
MRMSLPKPFNWDELWRNFVESVRRCTEIAKSYGVKLALEGHTHTMVPGTDTMLRIWDWVQDEALGFNMDTSWHVVQREFLPWSIHKLGDKLLHMHVRDSDGQLCRSLPAGMGIIDWHGVIEALRDVGYDGALSMEMHHENTRGDDPWYYDRWTLEYLRRVLHEA